MMRAPGIRRLQVLLCVHTVFAAATVFAGARDTSNRAALRSGIAEAQTCEAEIDDDLSNYRSCIDHLADRPSLTPHEKLGIRFQAWIIADLMARQHADFAARMRADQFEKMGQLQKKTRASVDELCEAKRIACNDIKARLKAASEPR